MRHRVDEAEGGQGQALDHDLHAQVGHVPARVGHDVVEQQAQVGVDRVVARELLVEVLGEDLDVAGLVHDLGGGVVLGVDPRHRSRRSWPCRSGRPARRAGTGRASSSGSRPRSAIHSLSPHFSSAVPREVEAGAERRPWSPRRSIDHALLVDLGLPGQVGLAVPLGALGLLVELVELGPGALLVVPGEDRVVVRVDDVAAVGLLGAHDREDGLEVVDLARGR